MILILKHSDAEVENTSQGAEENLPDSKTGATGAASSWLKGGLSLLRPLATAGPAPGPQSAEVDFVDHPQEVVRTSQQSSAVESTEAGKVGDLLLAGLSQLAKADHAPEEATP